MLEFIPQEKRHWIRFCFDQVDFGLVEWRHTPITKILDKVEITEKSFNDYNPNRHIVDPADFGLTQLEADLMEAKYLSDLIKYWLKKRREEKNDNDKYRIKILRKRIKATEEVIDNYYGRLLLTNKDIDIELISDDIEYYKNKVERYKSQLYFLSHKNDSNVKMRSFDIQYLKTIPIDNFVSINRAGFFKIRKDENTASTKYYKERNTWHDFGTGENGDVIDLIMKLKEYNFQEACNFLLGK